MRLGAVAGGPPLVLVGMIGAEDFEFTVIGNAGTTRVLFGPEGGPLAVGKTMSLGTDTGDVSGGALRADTAFAATTTGDVPMGTGAGASETDGLDSVGGVGSGGGDTVDMGVTLRPMVGSFARSFTGSSFGA